MNFWKIYSTEHSITGKSIEKFGTQMPTQKHVPTQNDPRKERKKYQPLLGEPKQWYVTDVHTRCHKWS